MLQSIFEAAIGNACVAAVMALVVFGVTRVWKNQYIAHALWVLVLVKLVTPPLWRIPVPIPPVLGRHTQGGEQPSPIANRARARQPADAYVAAETYSERFTDDSSSVDQASWPVEHELSGTNDKAGMDAAEIPCAAVRAGPDLGKFLWRAMMWGWLIASLTWTAVVIHRVARFNRLLRHTFPATPALERAAAAIGMQLGLRRTPVPRLTEATVGPMVWPASWRSIVVLPQRLVDELDEQQLSTIIAHELAHLRRGDHYVRFLEVAVVSLYWWNPIVWWVRRALHAAEAACCDAEVLRLFPDKASEYGDALLRTSEFLSSGRIPMPALASGFSGSCFLERRVAMILKNEFGRPASRAVRLALAAVAVAVMPLAAQVIPLEGEPAAANPSQAEKAATKPPAENTAAAKTSELEPLAAKIETLDLEAATIELVRAPELSQEYATMMYRGAPAPQDGTPSDTRYAGFWKDEDLACRVVHKGLKPREEYYVDRKYRLVEIPRELQGLTLVQTRNGNKSIVDGRYAIIVTSAEPCYCFVAISEYSVRGYEETGMPGWLEEYSLTNYRITTDDPRMNFKKDAGFVVLVRQAPAGRIALGPACNCPSSMYFAFFGRLRKEG